MTRTSSFAVQACLSIASAPLAIKHPQADHQDPVPAQVQAQADFQHALAAPVLEDSLEPLCSGMEKLDVESEECIIQSEFEPVSEACQVSKDHGEEEGVEGHQYVKAPEPPLEDTLQEAEDVHNTCPEDAEMEELVAGVVSLLSEDAVQECCSATEGEEPQAEDEEEKIPDTAKAAPRTLADARNRVEDVMQELKSAGLSMIRSNSMRFGKTLGEGAFGTVKLANVTLDGRVQECAVKTIIAKGKAFNDCLEAFETEANVSWAASVAARSMKQGKRSRVCSTLAVAYDVVRVPLKNKTAGTDEPNEEEAATRAQQVEEDVKAVGCEETAGAEQEEEGGEERAEGDSSKRFQIKAKLHLVMEKVDSRGDLHQEITSERWWDSIREGGEDTGRRLRGNYTMEDDEGDLFAYTMPRRAKLQLAEEFARGMIELRASNIVHCDIKPCNVLLVSVPHAKAGKAPAPGLKIIDFGEGNTPEEAEGFVAGTPGYQAPEVVDDGLCSFASDMYSTGVSLIELWAGDMWAGADTRGEGYPGQRKEVLAALSKIEKADPKAARVLRRCIAEKPAHRPTARQLLKAVKALRADAVPLRKVVAFKGRAWACK